MRPPAGIHTAQFLLQTILTDAGFLTVRTDGGILVYQPDSYRKTTLDIDSLYTVYN
jgi:hypothetical protein